MFSKIKISVMALVPMAACASLNAHAGSAELSVIGNISPSACTLTLSANGIVDYGKIDVSSLSDTAPTPLDLKPMNFTVNCDASTSVAMIVKDNRTSSKIPGLIGVNVDDKDIFGLGTANGKKIGGYTLSLGGLKGNGKIVSGGQSADGESWSNIGVYLTGDGSTMYSWREGSVSATPPGSFKSVAGELRVHAIINKTSQLDLTQKISLDGSATIELKYL